MTEADIITQLSAAYDRTWTMVQWWASISFLVIAAAHFASHKLNLLLVSVITVLYISYSLWMYRWGNYHGFIINGFYADLIRLVDSGHVLSTGAVNYMSVSSDGLAVWFRQVALIGTFLCTIYYLVSSALRNKNINE